VAKPNLTLDDLVLELVDRHSISIHSISIHRITIHSVSIWRVSISRVPRSLGLTHKKRHPIRRATPA
jgi:hypothetical protein